MAVEPRRACGFRKHGGLYLTAPGGGMPCDRLPFRLCVCPTCGSGIKQSRGWTWINVNSLLNGVHENCADEFPCPLCMDTGNLGMCGLLWVGAAFYKTPQMFLDEANSLGISKRISTIPCGFEVGRTWVLLAHPKAMACPTCGGSGLVNKLWECEECFGKGKVAGVFRVFKPTAIEQIVKQSDFENEEAMALLRRRGITPIPVPDDDKDHMGSVFDKDSEEGLFDA